MKVKKYKICVALIVVLTLLIPVVSYAAYRSNEKDRAKDRACFEIIDEEDLSTEERETICLINEYRNKNGLKSLKVYSDLQKVARLKAEDLLYNDYFAHTSATLGTPFEMIKASGIEYSIAGENLAGNTTPKRAVEAWINSKEHRDNILEEKYEYTAVYVIDSEVYGKIFVQLFMGA